MSPLVSVIIPNYNYARYLPERIDSVLRQTFQNFEIILLDDCSTDNSIEILEQYRSNPKVSAVEYNKENSGSTFRQWEKGLSLARGKYAWIAEADDLADPTFLERTVKAMEEGGDKMVGAHVLSQLINSEGKMFDYTGHDHFFTPNGKIEIYDGLDYIRSRMLIGSAVYNTSMAIFSIDAWRNIPDRVYLDMRYSGDWLFWGEIIRQGNVGVVREKLNSFRKHGVSVTDEGLRTRKAKFEDLKVLSRLYGYSGMKMNHDRRLREYRLVRDAGLDSPEAEFMGIGRLKYTALWLYKHLLGSLLKEKEIPLRPIMTL